MEGSAEIQISESCKDLLLNNYRLQNQENCKGSAEASLVKFRLNLHGNLSVVFAF